MTKSDGRKLDRQQESRVLKSDSVESLLNNGTILIMGLVVGHIFDAHKLRSDCVWNCIL